MIKQLTSRVVVLGMLVFVVACAPRAISYNDMLAMNHDKTKSVEGLFTGPIFIDTVKTPADEKYDHVGWALKNSLKSHQFEVVKEIPGAYVLNAELIRHERVIDTAHEDVYEVEIKYRILKPDSSERYFDQTLTTRFSSDQNLLDAERIKTMANDELGGTIGEIFVIGVFGAFGLNVAPAGLSPKPGIDTINIAEKDAIGNVIQANFRAFIAGLRSQKK